MSVMTGFIYEPLSRYTLQKWMENLGHKFDADRWVKNFQEAGASHVVFYDKWIERTGLPRDQDHAFQDPTRFPP